MFLHIMTPVCLINIAGSDTLFIPGGTSLMYIVTPELMTIPLMTNWSYDHSTFEKISVFCLFVKLQYFSCNVFNNYLINLFILCWRTLFLIFYNRKTTYINPPISLMEGVYSTSYLIFDLQPIRLTTKRLESMLFESQRVAVLWKITAL